MNYGPVVPFVFELIHINMVEARDAKGAFDRVARHGLSYYVAITNTVFEQMSPIERRGHRRGPALAIKFPRTLGFGNRGLKQRHLLLAAICLLQPGKRTGLRLN